jgi:allophanate hydrolase subunit 2
MITVVAWGVGARVVGRGVEGRARVGASRGGAADLAALDLVNRLLGNAGGAGALETSGGTVLSIARPTMVAVTGALAEVSVVGGPAVGWGAPTVLPVGATLRVGRLLEGARLYVGVRGGLAHTADGLVVGADPGSGATTVAAPPRELLGTARLWPGPRLAWFADGSFDRLCATEWSVTSTSRVGVRLAGAPLVRRRQQELPSEGMLEGAVQVPPDGQPIVMLADHPTTGGYPVIAVVDQRDLREVAQAAAGTTLRFVRA